MRKLLSRPDNAPCQRMGTNSRVRELAAGLPNHRLRIQAYLVFAWRVVLQAAPLERLLFLVSGCNERTSRKVFLFCPLFLHKTCLTCTVLFVITATRVNPFLRRREFQISQIRSCEESGRSRRVQECWRSTGRAPSWVHT
ncbi:uncharacterized protein BDW70DRAFT_83353 [Aspergillus foveolatus]|uniref:uncharacterized protein n=1 Tax=Aspergillus foveolatus TaxID=210207 RepID=UPI003CCDDDD4